MDRCVFFFPRLGLAWWLVLNYWIMNPRQDGKGVQEQPYESYIWCQVWCCEDRKVRFGVEIRVLFDVVIDVLGPCNSTSHDQKIVVLDFSHGLDASLFVWLYAVTPARSLSLVPRFSTMAWYAFDRRLFVYLAIILIPFFILFRIHIYILTTTPAWIIRFHTFNSYGLDWCNILCTGLMAIFSQSSAGQEDPNIRGLQKLTYGLNAD